MAGFWTMAVAVAAAVSPSLLARRHSVRRNAIRSDRAATPGGWCSARNASSQSLLLACFRSILPRDPATEAWHPAQPSHEHFHHERHRPRRKRSPGHGDECQNEIARPAIIGGSNNRSCVLAGRPSVHSISRTFSVRALPFSGQRSLGTRAGRSVVGQSTNCSAHR